MNLSFFLAFQTLYIKQCLTVKDKREYHWDGMYCESLLANQNLDITTFGNYQKRKKKKKKSCSRYVLHNYSFPLLRWSLSKPTIHMNNMQSLHKNIFNSNVSLNVIVIFLTGWKERIFMTYKSIRIKLIFKSIVWWGIC